jgi:hypothetical protein
MNDAAAARVRLLNPFGPNRKSGLSPTAVGFAYPLPAGIAAAILVSHSQ